MIVNQLLSVGDVVGSVGVSKDTVHGWTNDKRPHAHPLKKRFWKYKRVQVDKWVHSGKAADEQTNENDE